MNKSLALPSFASLGINSLTVKSKITIDEAEGFGAQLAILDDASPWWQGDFVNWCQKTFAQDDAWAQVIPEGKEALWYKHAWVCSKFVNERRRPRLSFTHHELVSKFTPQEQDAFLDVAEQEHLSISDFRRLLKGDTSERVDWRELAELRLDYLERALEMARAHKAHTAIVAYIEGCLE